MKPIGTLHAVYRVAMRQILAGITLLNMFCLPTSVVQGFAAEPEKPDNKSVARTVWKSIEPEFRTITLTFAQDGAFFEEILLDKSVSIDKTKGDIILNRGRWEMIGETILVNGFYRGGPSKFTNEFRVINEKLHITKGPGSQVFIRIR